LPTVQLKEIVQLLVAIGLLAVVMSLAWWGLGRLRRYFRPYPPGSRSSGWTMEQIEKLHQSGQLTDQQYRALREAVIKDINKMPSA